MTARLTKREWQPRYVAYALSQGRAPEEQLRYDEDEWPGGRMAGFVLWIGERWQEWSTETGEQRANGGAWNTRQHELFDRWLVPDQAGPPEAGK